jgi:hypothetical protein
MSGSAADENWTRWLETMKEQVSPSRIDHPFRVVAEKEESAEIRDEKGKREIRARSYDLEAPYLDMEGRPKTGKAHLFMPLDATEPVPLVVNLHYESGLAGMAAYAAQGWACMSAAEALNPFGESINFNIALAQAGRAMPFVDGQRIALTGGSAGGYVTLMVASEVFPVTALVPLAPIVNLSYNIAHLDKNAGPAECGEKDGQGRDASRVPIFCSVAGVIKAASEFLGPREKMASNWMANSPLGAVKLITSPVQVAFSTADVLVPINQVGAGLASPTPASFPEGFAFEMGSLVEDRRARGTFLQALGRNSAKVYRVKVPESLPAFWEQSEQQQSPPTHEISPPFSRQALFSVVILDEGPPDPRLGHFKRIFAYSSLEFLKHWMQKRKPIDEGQLTTKKLTALMRRFLGEKFEGVLSYEGKGRKSRLVNRRNRPGKEKLDVILGLRGYCQTGKAHRAHLAALYSRLPSALRALDAGAGPPKARFSDDIEGGLAFHEALLHHRYGDREKAIELANSLMKSKKHEAYASCLPARLRAAAAANR